MEKRILTYQTETRALDDNGKKYIEGIIPYNSKSRSIAPYLEIIEPTAFNKTLADGADVKLIKEHDTKQIVARTKNGSLELNNQPDGLHWRAILNESPLSLGIYEDVKSGLLDNVSFGMIPVKEDWEHRSIGSSVRHVNEAKLMEISIVAEPWYANAKVQTRSLDELEHLITIDKPSIEEKEVIRKYINELQEKIKEPDVTKDTQEPVKATPAAQYYDDLLKGL